MATPLSSNLDWDAAKNLWAQSLNPVLGNPLLSGNAIGPISLVTGVNIINHGLGRVMQGWMITDQNASASFYRSSPLNDKTLILTSNAAVKVMLWVY